MHQPPAFVQTDPAKIRAAIAENSFGVLATHGPAGLEASHVPFLLCPGEGELVLEGHLAAANRQAAAVRAGGEALAIFQGPHAPISPAWYATRPAVPTWDYVAVHVHGVLEVVEGPALVALMRRQGATDAEGFALDSVPEPLLGKLLGAIVGFRLRARHVEAQWKLSQNRSEADRRGVVAGLRSRNANSVADLVAATLSGAD